VIWAVVASAAITPIVVEPVVVEPVTTITPVDNDAVMSAMMLDLVLTLLVVRRIIGAAARLRDRGNGDCARRGEHAEAFHGTEMHVWDPPGGLGDRSHQDAVRRV
jgi:hypothetical protein